MVATVSNLVTHFQRSTIRAFAIAALAISGALTTGAWAQAAAQPSVTPTAPVPAKPAVMEKFSGVWVEGPGFDITYGKAYDVCAQRCLANATCKMIEYYRPQKKCNMYAAERPRLKGGSSEVAIRR